MTTYIEQYDAKTDPSGFLGKARKHQSNFRENVLKVPMDGLGSYLLPEDAEKGLNFYDGFGIWEAVRKKTKGRYNRNIWSNMLRSEHIPFNLFVPLEKNREYCRKIFGELLQIEITSIDTVTIEYAPKPKEKYLDDHTSFDTYIEYTNSMNEKGIVGIEVKYTEREYVIDTESTSYKKAADPTGKYREVSLKSGLFKPEAYEVLHSHKFRQVWRNHILGESILQVDGDKYRHFTSLTLFPKGNVHFLKTSKEYMNLLITNENKFIPLTYEDFILLLEKHRPDESYQPWIDYLKTRYLF